MSASRNDSGNPTLPSGKNLHASVPPALLARVQREAEATRVTLDELVAEAIEQRLNRSGLEDVLAYGRRRARDRGLTPADVEETIAAVRGRNSERGR